MTRAKEEDMVMVNIPNSDLRNFYHLLGTVLHLSIKTAIQSPENLKKFMISFKKEQYPNEDTMKCKTV